jgi:threonine dehydrogenase-like Zn-dependent dehydrogenase
VVNLLETLPDRTSDPVLDAVHRIIRGGVEIGFDATGTQSTMVTALTIVKLGGVVFNVVTHEKLTSSH